MTTTTNPVPQKHLRGDDTIQMKRWLRAPALPGRWLRAPAVLVVTAWWQHQAKQTRTGLVVAAVFAIAGTLSLCASLTRPAQADAPRATSPAALTQEASSPDAGKTWAVTKGWQGSGTRETETFTVTGHWRVDWIFSPSSSAGGVFQVYIYSADGRQLLNLAANSQKGGSDTTFWAGPGTYFLKINSSGGDWKVGVQDLH
jgi:hypothetical protein